MCSESISSKSINAVNSTELLLESSDQVWLDSYGVNSSWQNNQDLVSEINQLIIDGSCNMANLEDQDKKDRILLAREKFFSFANIPNETLTSYRDNRPNLMPIDTFVRSQRMITELGLNAADVSNAFPFALGSSPETMKAKFNKLTELGLDAAKIINTEPATLYFTPESIQTKVDNLIELGLDAKRVISIFPAALGYASESVQAKVSNLTELGLNAVSIINSYPPVIGRAPELIQTKFNNLTDLGLDAAKIINTSPVVLGYALESVKAKINNLVELGLDASKVINALPAALTYGPESIQAKVDFLQKSINFLHWNYSAVELIESYPGILGFSTEKLKTLCRIAAERIDISGRDVEPRKIGNALIKPIEKYIAVLAEHEDKNDFELNELVRLAKRNKEPAPERRENAMKLAPNLGKIGLAYIRYRQK